MRRTVRFNFAGQRLAAGLSNWLLAGIKELPRSRKINHLEKVIRAVPPPSTCAKSAGASIRPRRVYE